MSEAESAVHRIMKAGVAPCIRKTRDCLEVLLDK